MKTIFVATSNKGKQAEIAAYAKRYGGGVVVRFPDATNEIVVDESGTTFEQNALLKAQAHKELLQDDSMLYVGDDSGIKISALGGAPGVYTRRWAGHEMTDQEIRDYCMEKMQSFHGEDRRAVFVNVLVVLGKDGEPTYLTNEMPGYILEEPVDALPIEGLPFNSLFWIEELNRPIYELRGLSPKELRGFLTHRQKGLKQLFEQFG